jgi:hypothetical protein
LTLGGDTLAVDGVLLVGEHGEYPYNELGQHLYPRKEFFDEIVALFRATGRTVPIFCDKHLSWNSRWAQEMVATARAMGFPLMAGSSVPYSLRLQPPLPPGERLSEGLGLFYVGPEVYGFHSLEGMASLIETRAGGEQGIVALTAYVGDQVWEQLDQGNWPVDLFDAALAAVIEKTPGDLRANCKPTPAYAHHPSPVAYRLEHADGLTTTHIMLTGHIQEFSFAVRTAAGKIHANRWEAGGPATFYGHFATLDSQVEQMFLTGQAPAPVERTLLTTMTIATCMEALARPGERLHTPHLQIAYQPTL